MSKVVAMLSVFALPHATRDNRSSLQTWMDGPNNVKNMNICGFYFFSGLPAELHANLGVVVISWGSLVISRTNLRARKRSIWTNFLQAKIRLKIQRVRQMDGNVWRFQSQNRKNAWWRRPKTAVTMYLWRLHAALSFWALKYSNSTVHLTNLLTSRTEFSWSNSFENSFKFSSSSIEGTSRNIAVLKSIRIDALRTSWQRPLRQPMQLAYFDVPTITECLARHSEPLPKRLGRVNIVQKQF